MFSSPPAIFFCTLPPNFKFLEITMDLSNHILYVLFATSQWLRQVDPLMDVRNASGLVTVLNKPYLVLDSGQTMARTDGTYLNKLVIPDTTEQDGGVYICTKTDSHGFGYRSAYLSVLAGN